MTDPSRRVLFLIGGLGPGGSEHQARLLLAGAPRSRVEFHLGCFGGYPEELKRVADAGVPIHILEATPRWSWPPRIMLAIRRLIRRHRIEIVHTCLPTFDILGPVFKAVSSGVRLVTSRRSLDEYLSARDVRLLRLTGGLADAIVANSEAVAASVARLEGRQPPKVRVIPNGVEVPEPVQAAERAEARRTLGLADGETMILYLAHFRRGKGHDYVPAVAARVHGSLPKLRVIVGGDRELNAMYRQNAARFDAAVSEAGLDEHVRCLGPISDQRSLFAAADLFMSLSDSEGMSNSVMQAMAYGLPVVATAVGGTPELIRDGQDGLLIPPGDHVAAADRVTRLATEPETSRRLGESARRRIVNDFSIERMIERYTTLYDELR